MTWFIFAVVSGLTFVPATEPFKIPDVPITWTVSKGGRTHDPEILIRIKADGQIEYGPQYRPDAAVRLFWERCAPEIIVSRDGRCHLGRGFAIGKK